MEKSFWAHRGPLSLTICMCSLFFYCENYIWDKNAVLSLLMKGISPSCQVSVRQMTGTVRFLEEEESIRNHFSQVSIAPEWQAESLSHCHLNIHSYFSQSPILSSLFSMLGGKSLFELIPLWEPPNGCFSFLFSLWC